VDFILIDFRDSNMPFGVCFSSDILKIPEWILS